jgi:hypothetical protein
LAITARIFLTVWATRKDADLPWLLALAIEKGTDAVEDLCGRGYLDNGLYERDCHQKLDPK